MMPLLLYIGPGIGMGTIVIVLLVLLIVFASFVMILWTSLQMMLTRIRDLFRKKEQG